MATEIIGADMLVLIDYKLSDDAGEELDSSAGGEPLAYIHGHGQIVEGLEKALEGKTLGDMVQIRVTPKEGYGEHNPEMITKFPRDRFDFDIEVGLVVQAQMPNGQGMPYQIIALDDKEVTMDGNHPLAGKNLNFDVKVVGVRAVSEEELKQLEELTCSDGSCSDEGCSCC